MDFLNLMTQGNLNWEAISSLATFAAVIVALLPTFAEYKRRRVLARNLRGRLLAHLIVLRSIAERCQDKSSITLSEGELKSIHAITAMMPELSVLEKGEHEHLWQMMADLKFLEAYPSTVNKIDKNSLDAINKIINDFGKRLSSGK